jgi:hypothetical protein
MRKALRVLAWAGLVGACLGGLSASGFAGMSGGLGDAVPLHRPYTPVAVWKDCQAIARCTGCKPVYRCRSCSYQRTCQGGVCGWGDVCVWGPYVKVLPRGARIVRE